MKYKKSTIQIIQKIRNSIQSSSLNLNNLKIAVAVSGGADSMALLHALNLGKFFFPYEMIVLHINHGWRGVESDQDQNFVVDYSQKYNIPCYTYNCPSQNKDISAEKEASDQRKAVFKEWVQKGYTIFTAHNANDVLETLIWRLCDGKLETHDKGILQQTKDGQFRPLLTTTKDELINFLTNEDQEWREDRTNYEGKLMRSKLRLNVIPELLKVYPQAIKKVSDKALAKQKISL